MTNSIQFRNLGNPERKSDPFHQSSSQISVKSETPKLLYITSLSRSGKTIITNWTQWFQRTGQNSIDFEPSSLVTEEVSLKNVAQRLRQQNFDLIITIDDRFLNALSVLQAIQACDVQIPILVLTKNLSRERELTLLQNGMKVWDLQETDPSLFDWQIQQSIQEHQLKHQVEKLEREAQTRVQRESDDVQQILNHQRSLVDSLNFFQAPPQAKSIASQYCSPAFSATQTPSPIRDDQQIIRSIMPMYRELLKAFVMMETGSFEKEIKTLTEVLKHTSLTGRNAVQLHVEALEELLSGLGNRSSRHIIDRADLLILEVLISLTDLYGSAKNQPSFA